MCWNKSIYRAFSSFIILLLLISGAIVIVDSNSNKTYAKATSSWLNDSYTDFKKGTLTNSTIEGYGQNAELRIDVSKLPHWTEHIFVTKPSARVSTAMATIFGVDKVLLFGGSNPGAKDDTWVYDSYNNTWTDKNPTIKPVSRFNHVMASIYGDDKVLLFGGYSNNYQDDTWIYDLSSNTWVQKYPKTKPSPMTSSGMATICGNDKVLLFGGSKTTGSHDETWIYDLSDNNWTRMFPVHKPGKKSGHTMAAIYGTDKVLLFGPNDETWIYDHSENDWTQKTTTNKPPEGSDAEMAQIYKTDKVLLCTRASSDQETWIFDLSETTWRFKAQEIKPNATKAMGLASVHGTDKVVLFGGGEYPNYYDDTWVYAHGIPPMNGTFVSEVYDTCSNSSFEIMKWTAETPIDTCIKFQLRSSANEVGINEKPFIGPEGTTDSYYISSPSKLWAGHYGSRWIQYKAYFNMSIITDSPILKNVTILYNCLPQTQALIPAEGKFLSTNKPTFTWSFLDIDSTDQEAFQVLIDDDVDFTSIDFDSGIQHSSNSNWDFPAGTSYYQLPDGLWYWKVRTMDMDNAWTEFSTSRSFQVDTQPPNSIKFSPKNDGFYNKINIISGEASDEEGGSGLYKVEIAIKRLSDNNYWDGTTWVRFSTWLLVSGTDNWTYISDNVQWESGNKYSFQSRAVDFAGNIEQSNLVHFFSIDKDNPSSIINYPTNNSWLNDLDTISGTSFDPIGPGIEKVEISIMCTADFINLDVGSKENDYWDGLAWTPVESWLSANGTYDWSCDISSVTFSTYNKYLIRSRATDKTGNTEIPNKDLVFLFDDQPPERLEINIQNNSLYTKSTRVQLSLKAEDFGSGVREMSISTDGLTWQQWEPFSEERLLTLPAIDGEKVIYFRVRDSAGNVAEHVWDSIFLDTTPSENLSIEINERAKYTNSTKLQLQLTASDLGSGLGDMAFSINAIDWTTWEPFSHEKTFTILPVNGESFVYFKVRDKAGNIAIQVFDSIILDTVPPHSLKVEVATYNLSTSKKELPLKLYANDDLSGVCLMSFSTDGENWTGWESFCNERSFTSLAIADENIVYFKVKDNAGNIAKPMFFSFAEEKTSSESAPSTRAAIGMELWIALVFIVTILLIIILLLVISIKRKKRIANQLYSAGTITIKPGQLTAALLPAGQNKTGTLYTLPTSGSHDAPIQPLTSVTAPAPALAKFTQTTLQQHSDSTQPSTEPAQALPQLPPANLQKHSQQPKSPITQPTPLVSKKPEMPSHESIQPEPEQYNTIASKKTESQSMDQNPKSDTQPET